MSTKVLAITLGDRYGVGPELVAQLPSAITLPADVAAVVLGDRAAWDAGRRVSGASNISATTVFGAAPGGTWSFLDRPVYIPTAPMGWMSADAGSEVLGTLGELAAAVRTGQIGGIVYGPLNKQALKAAGHAAGDELDYLNTHLKATGATGEVNILGELWTSRVTSHVPLSRVAGLITRERVGAGIALLNEVLRRAGRHRPRLAIAALNPHAGEGGAFGSEEIEVLRPAIETAVATGIDAQGPFPADTVFPRALDGDFDGVVTMFHDQGQIALKLVGLGKGITLLAGFPVPIATPGHGTAYDIAGTGRARSDGLIAATRLVLDMMMER